MKFFTWLVAAVAVAGVAAPRMAFADQAVAAAGSLTVQGNNDEYVESGIIVKTGDLLRVQSSGTVVTGSWNGATKNPWGHINNPCDTTGTETDGALMMKIGTGAAVRIGDNFFGTTEREGALKFRVRDTKYTDNSGAYSVTLLHVPKEALTEVKSVEVEAANDEWTAIEASFEPNEVVLIKADGASTVRGKAATPRGTQCNGNTPVSWDDDGGLAVKSGKTLQQRVGSMILDSPGKDPLKFRVRSGNKYEGNKGAYSVVVSKAKLAASAR